MGIVGTVVAADVWVAAVQLEPSAEKIVAVVGMVVAGEIVVIVGMAVAAAVVWVAAV